jgi:hypothetical protein
MQMSGDSTLAHQGMLLLDEQSPRVASRLGPSCDIGHTPTRGDIRAIYIRVNDRADAAWMSFRSVLVVKGHNWDGVRRPCASCMC